MQLLGRSPWLDATKQKSIFVVFRCETLSQTFRIMLSSYHRCLSALPLQQNVFLIHEKPLGLAYSKFAGRFYLLKLPNGRRDVSILLDGTDYNATVIEWWMASSPKSTTPHPSKKSEKVILLAVLIPVLGVVCLAVIAVVICIACKVSVTNF